MIFHEFCIVTDCGTSLHSCALLRLKGIVHLRPTFSCCFVKRNFRLPLTVILLINAPNVYLNSNQNQVLLARLMLFIIVVYITCSLIATEILLVQRNTCNPISTRMSQVEQQMNILPRNVRLQMRQLIAPLSLITRHLLRRFQ